MSRVTHHLPPGVSPSPAKGAPVNLPSYAQTAKQVRQHTNSKPDASSGSKNQSKDPKVKMEVSKTSETNSAAPATDSGRSISPQSRDTETRHGVSGVKFPPLFKPTADANISFFAPEDLLSGTLKQKTYTFTTLSFGEGVSVTQPSKQFSAPSSLRFSAKFHHAFKSSSPIENITKAFPEIPSRLVQPAPPAANGGPKSGAPPIPPLAGPTPPYPKQQGFAYMPGQGFSNHPHYAQYSNPHMWPGKGHFQMPSGQPVSYRSPNPHPRAQDKPNASPVGPPPPMPAAGFQASSPNAAMGMPNLGLGPGWHPQSFYPNYQMPGFDPGFNYGNYLPPPHAFHTGMPPPAGALPHLNSNAVPFVPKPAPSKAIKIVNPNSGQALDLSTVAQRKESTTTPTATSMPVRISKPAPQAQPKPEITPPREAESEISKPADEELKPKPVEAETSSPTAKAVVESPQASKANVNGGSPPGVEAKPEPPVVEVKEVVVEEPTIISTNTETVILKKSKPKRSVRAETKLPIVPLEEPKESPMQETEAEKKCVEPKAEVEPGCEPQSELKPDSELEAATNVEDGRPNSPQPEVRPGETSSPSARALAAPPGFAERKPTVAHDDDLAGLKPNGSSPAEVEPAGPQPPPSRLEPGSPTPQTISSPRTPEFFDQVSYPPHISRPVLPDGKFRYDRTFLLQFREMCVDKPHDMKHVDSITDEIRGDGGRGHRGGKSGSFRGPSGDFGRPKTSEDRFKLSNLQVRHDGRNPLVRSSSGGVLGMANNLAGKDMRNRGGRGGRGSRPGSHHPGQDHGSPTIPLEEVEPLQVSENRWVPRKDDQDKEAMTTRKVKALLNKLTLEKFDAISSQLIDIANESAEEEGGETLKLVIQIIFEKATDEPNFSSIYAQLCRKMRAELDPKISDHKAHPHATAPITGGHLFRRYLVSRCQTEFTKGWKTDDVQKHQGAVDLLSDEYYAAAKAKRQGLGLIRFIGELFKLGMLKELVMKECINGMLLKENIDEEEVESLFKLMTTIGKQFDTSSNAQEMSTYFAIITKLSRDEKLPQRARFMLQDLIDLRKHRWESRRNAAAGPKTLQEIKQDADREAEEKLKQQEKLRRTASSGFRQSSLPRPERSDKARTAEGWNTVSGPPATRNRTGDLSSFGNLSRSKANAASLSLGPSPGSVFNSLGSLRGSSRDGASSPRKAPGLNSSNMFNMLAEGEPKSDPPTRQPLKLLPKSAPSEPALTDEAFKLKAENTLKELWALGDYSEAMLSLKELASVNRNGELVYQFMAITLERRDDDISKAASLFSRAVDERVISMDSFLEGAKKMAADLDDLSIDVPAAFDHMAALLAAVSMPLASLLDLMGPLTLEPSRLPHGPKLFIPFIKHRLQSQEDGALIEELKSESCNLTKLYHKDNQTPEFLAKLISNSALGSLAPTITATAWWKALHPAL
ncbi:hypothetical protein L0F63_002071 [Massospora cicadina]|nr:hypothetical protein L0F63_002071 [Massospora cicadina]